MRVRYCHCVIVASFGFVHVNARLYAVPVAAVSVLLRPVGRAGTGIGVARASSDSAPSPARLTARIWNRYPVLFVSPPTVCDAVSASLPAMSCQLP